MKIVDRYLVRAVLLGTLQVLLALMALNLFLNFLAEIEHVGGGYGILQALGYVLLQLPEGAYEMFPIAVLLGTLFGLGSLAAGRELMVMRASGLSLVRLTSATLVAGAVLMVCCYLLGDLAAPQGNQLAIRLKAQAESGHATMQIHGHLWLRDGNRFVSIAELQSRRRAAGIDIYRFSDSHRLVVAAHARSATIGTGRWTLHDYAASRFGPEGVRVTHQANKVWSTRLSPGLLDLFVVKPESLTLPGLYRYIRYLRGNGLEYDRYETKFWAKVVEPFTVPAMVLLAIPFIFGPLRSVGTGQRVLVGVVIGVLYYLANNALLSSAQVYGINPAVTAWLPTVLIVAAAVWGIRRVR